MLTALSFLPFTAGSLSLLLACLAIVRKRSSLATWCFSAGMVALGIDSLFTGLALRTINPPDAAGWLTRSFIVKTFTAAPWLLFSLIYSRGAYRESLERWRVPVVAIGVLLPAFSLAFLPLLGESASVDAPVTPSILHLSASAKVLNGMLIVALVLTLTNLEQTFRAAIGTMRWRIKYVVLGCAVIFGTQIYARSQAILFSVYDLRLANVECGALLIGCVFLGIAHARTGLVEIDVYPSLAVLRSSLTLLIVGLYLFVVGVLAQLVRRFGGEELLELQAFVVVFGLSGLAVLLLSDRARQTIHVLVVRHFRRPRHDSAQIWTSLSQRLASVQDEAVLCAAAARLMSETFDVLSVRVWLRDAESGRLVQRASTAAQRGEPDRDSRSEMLPDTVARGLSARTSPFDVEQTDEPWAQELRRMNPSTFQKGGKRLAVPLRSADQILGTIVLADRVGAVPYAAEETELLKCIGDQITSVLLNLRLAGEVAQARELEAFSTMSTFFVHDLKNAAASLNLTLKNLPVHFDDPAFRADALRAIGNTAGRIGDMIARLSALRERPDFALVEVDLNQLVTETLAQLGDMPGVELTTKLQPLPRVAADARQMQSVVTNLVLNARDALPSGGRIRVGTETRDARVLLSVEDNGCGMSPEFVQKSLFRPFQSTKGRGLGVGLFQCRKIVRAHGGGIHVESTPGERTVFVVDLPTVKERR